MADDVGDVFYVVMLENVYLMLCDVGYVFYGR